MPALLLPLEHRQQEVESGCLAACAQMALLWLGINVSQTELNQTDLFLHDPAFPDAPRRVSAAEFMLAWDEFDNTFAQITEII